MSDKYSQKFFDHTKQSATYTLKSVWKRAIQKIAEATCDLIGNKIPRRIISGWNKWWLACRVRQW